MYLISPPVHCYHPSSCTKLQEAGFDVMLASASPVPFVIARSTGHSGSLWLAELLGTQNLSFFFEFSGDCPKRYPMANASLKELFDVGCQCTGLGTPSSKRALCSGRCPQRDPHGCLAVGWLNSYSAGWLTKVTRFLHEHQATGEPVNLVTFERDNSVKHAISKLKVRARPM